MISDLLRRLGGATWSLQKKVLWVGVEVTVLWPGTGCFRDTEEETSPRRCLTCQGLHSTVSCPAGYAAPYLTVFGENSIDVFDVRKAEWVQTVPLKKVRACPDPPALDWGCSRAARLTSVPAASGATPKPRGLPVPLWHGEGPPDLPQEPAGR